MDAIDNTCTGEVVNEPVGQALVTTAAYVFLRTRGSYL